MLTSKQRARLASLASSMDPVVHLGKAGLSDAVTAMLSTALADHELVKLRFVDYKGEKREFGRALAEATGAELVRVIGNVVIFYREHDDPDLRRISLDDDDSAVVKPRSAVPKRSASPVTKSARTGKNAPAKSTAESRAGKGVNRSSSRKAKSDKQPRRTMGPGR